MALPAFQAVLLLLSLMVRTCLLESTGLDSSESSSLQRKTVQAIAASQVEQEMLSKVSKERNLLLG